MKLPDINHLDTMKEKKFILSDKFELVENPEVPHENRFTMFNKVMEESILLNEPIFVFLKNFEKENSLQTVTDIFAELTQSSKENVQPIIQNFFQQMSRRGVLIPFKIKRGNKNFEERNKIFPVGHFIDEFCIEKHLSSNMPIHVYLAEDTLKNKKTILKILQFSTQMNEKQRDYDLKLFEKEFAILRSITHPNIAACLDFRNTYAVIEHVEGQELYRKIKDKTTPDLAVRLSWLSQVYDAMAYLHKKNILHGDMHYSNVLITNDNTAKLIDFDLACYVNDTNTAIGGMRPFIAPERIDLNAFQFYKNLPDFRSEVHQLGVLSFFVIYGRLPFQGETWNATAKAICENVPNFDDKDNFGNEVSTDLKKFLEKSLQKNPILRFASAGEAVLDFSTKNYQLSITKKYAN